MDRDGDTDPRVRARQLFKNQNVGEEVGACARIFLRHAGSHQPQLGQLPEELLRKMVLAVPLGRVRLDLGGRELPGQRLDLTLLRGQLEVHGRRLDGCVPPSDEGGAPIL